MTENHFSHSDHEMLAELVTVTEELRDIAKPRNLYHRVKFWAALAAGAAFSIGIVLLLGSDARISASSYWVLHIYGGHIVWGFGFIAVSMFTFLCVWRFPQGLRWALILQALPFGAIAVSFAIAAFKYPDANLTAAPIYTWIMLMHTFLSDYARKEY